MHALIRPALLAGIIVSTGIGVVACGGGSGSSSPSSTAAAASSSAVASASSTNGADRADAGRNPYADPTVQACLSAAGIAVPTFARPSGSFTRPSGSFTRPSGSFTRPSGSFTRPSGGAGGNFGGTDSPEFQKIQQALTACGISLPTGGRGSGAPAPSGAPSS